MLRLALASSPGLMLLMTALTISAALLPLGVAHAGKRIIDAVVSHDQALTMRWALFEFATVALLTVCVRSSALVRAVLGARLTTDINLQILQKAIRLELTFFETADFYDTLTRARREVSTRPVAVITDSLQVLQNALTLVGYALLLSHFSGWMVLGLLLAAAPATVAEMWHSRIAFRVGNLRSPDARRLAYLEHVLATDRHAKEIKLFGLGDFFFGRYRSLAEAFYAQDKRLAVRRAVSTQGLSLLATVAFYAAYAVLALEAALGQLTLGNLTLYVVALRQGQQAFQGVLTSMGHLYEHNLYMSNLFSYLELTPSPRPAVLAGQHVRVEPGAADNVQAAPLALPVPEGQQGLWFENVGFRYPGKEKFALRGITLRISGGESLALVGHNGAGKTTLVKLLAGLYQPTEGRILLDGVDLASWPDELRRRRLGVVLQDFNRYHLSLRDNVAIGSLDHFSDLARVQRALCRGGADDIVRELPLGLNQPLGKWFEDGSELSGGQWQKIALSRAFMREEADILVLDEPTAALDAESEHALFERFRQLSTDRTTIVISHRFPAARMAQSIVVLEKGTVVEQGTHEELLAHAGHYARMFALQAAGYR